MDKEEEEEENEVEEEEKEEQEERIRKKGKDYFSWKQMHGEPRLWYSLSWPPSTSENCSRSGLRLVLYVRPDPAWLCGYIWIRSHVPKPHSSEACQDQYYGY